ncbi:hypothetical protein TRVA0_021S01024 [Trichomonascus vanleenenianus]|uniref:uncharacterized protein n=1 Tax=Trichomonascus vanleenenianus TaxID=2268995 RepID=UPI003EC9A37E
MQRRVGDSVPSTPSQKRHFSSTKLLRRPSPIEDPSTPAQSQYSGHIRPPHRLSSLSQVTIAPLTPETTSSPMMSPSMASLGSSGTVHSASRRSFTKGAYTGSPLYYGPSTSVSSLGCEGDRPAIVSSSSSSSEDGYEEGMDSVEHDASYFSPHRRRLSAAPTHEPHDSLLGGSFRHRLAKAEESRSVSESLLGAGGPRAAIRQLKTSSKALKPKVKSFLRISRDLREELSPLDYEIKREAEVTSALRDDEDTEPSLKFPPPVHHSPFLEEEINKPRQRRQSKPFVLRSYGGFGGPSDTDDSDINVPLSPSASISSNASVQNYSKGLKRKATLVEESEPTVLKRRAVSPGLSSPIVGGNSSPAATPGPISKRASLKQMQDASEGFQNMTL